MKILLPLAFVFLPSCLSLYYTQDYIATDLSSVPSRSVQAPEIFYVNESLPESPYLETVDMQLTLSGEANADLLVDLLMKKAAYERVDGVIILDGDQVSFERAVQTSPYDVLTGIRAIGFMYLENIDYLDHLIKDEELFFMSDSASSPQQLGFVDYLPDGAPLEVRIDGEKGMHFYQTYIEPFSHFHLLKEDVNWVDSYDGGKLVGRELLEPDGRQKKKLKLTYNKGGTISVIRMALDEMNAQDYYHLHYRYRADDQVKERVVYKDGARFFKEKFFYDVDGRLIAKDYYRYAAGVEKHFLKSLYSHYFNHDLRDALQRDSAFVVHPSEYGR